MVERVHVDEDRRRILSQAELLHLVLCPSGPSQPSLVCVRTQNLHEISSRMKPKVKFHPVLVIRGHFYVPSSGVYRVKNNVLHRESWLNQVVPSAPLGAGGGFQGAPVEKLQHNYHHEKALIVFLLHRTSGWILKAVLVRLSLTVLLFSLHLSDLICRRVRHRSEPTKECSF